MPVRNLNRIFQPRQIAVVGASSKPNSVGYTVFRNLIEGGFEGNVFPVNPKYTTIQEQTAYPSVGDLPEKIDLAIICTRAVTVPGVVAECGEAGIRGIIVLSAGFREAGAAGEALEQKLHDTVRKYDGMRLIGPNCLGIIAPHAKLNASFAASVPDSGQIAFISQSGALGTSVLDWAVRDQIGFSHFVSVGNMLDVGMADLIDYFAQDPKTSSIILYIESIADCRQFMSAARAFTRQKPIVAYKAGRFPESAQAAASHTGAMAGVDAVYEAGLARAGIVRVHEIEDLFGCAQLLARRQTPAGSRLAIVTNAGGPGVMATDSLLEHHGELAVLSEATIQSLSQCLPAAWSHGNPVDVLGDATAERFAQALELTLADENVDAVLVILTPQSMTDPTAVARSVAEIEAKSSKPMLVSWMGGALVSGGIDIFHEAGVPTYSTPEQAVRAFTYLRSYARNREVLYETPRDIPVEFPLDRTRLRAVFNTILSEGHDVLTESTSKALLDAYEIPITRPFVARTAEDAVEFAHRIGYPVVLKVFSPQITHKTDVGGVVLNLNSDGDVRSAFDQVVAAAKESRPDASVEGVTVQQMIRSAAGHELILGARRDPLFGPVLMVGFGGIAAELFQDRALELPPLNERLARRMLESLRSWPLLQGYRGRPAVDVDRLVEVLIRFSYLVADYPEILEIDVNPLLVTPRDVVALDARIILDHQTLLHPAREFSHLAIQPYPEKLVRLTHLNDGTSVRLRPIKPEDEPMWHTLLASCSEESIRFRFFHLIRQTTHEMATRYCFIDYDREMAIVAEVEIDGHRVLVGVGRLVADADHTNAEYAILVTDDWQNKGVGNLLTDYCLEICQSWGIDRVVAETDPENRRMIHMFQKRGFEVHHDRDVVSVSRTLT
ncbi:MAG: bifunctional acetate--CoA ligase family protein/GNAT family N-acetyltransferase [Rhodopirellula sp.]|nr:bifunctional acetate--CoA ligase family protein/GNAT family N-acetyltransferase [Rhodopirellula sp.]